MQDGTVGTVIQVNVDSMMFFYSNTAKVKKNKANMKINLKSLLNYIRSVGIYLRNAHQPHQQILQSTEMYARINCILFPAPLLNNCRGEYIQTYGR